MAPQPVSDETELALSLIEEALQSTGEAYVRIDKECADLRRENRAYCIEAFRNRRLANCSLILAAAMAATAIAGWAAFLLKGLR